MYYISFIIIIFQNKIKILLEKKFKYFSKILLEISEIYKVFLD
jgi:hypothetical protein